MNMIKTITLTALLTATACADVELSCPEPADVAPMPICPRSGPLDPNGLSTAERQGRTYSVTYAELTSSCGPMPGTLYTFVNPSSYYESWKKAILPGSQMSEEIVWWDPDSLRGVGKLTLTDWVKPDGTTCSGTYLVTYIWLCGEIPAPQT